MYTMIMRFEFTTLLPAVQDFLRAPGLDQTVPVIAAGGIRNLRDIRRQHAVTWAAAAVRWERAFAMTEEGDAHPAYSRKFSPALAAGTSSNSGVARLPARASALHGCRGYLKVESTLKAAAHKARCAKVRLPRSGAVLRRSPTGDSSVDNQLVCCTARYLKKGSSSGAPAACRLATRSPLCVAISSSGCC